MNTVAHKLSIRINAGERHFVDGLGRPFFWLGDTAWPLFSQYTFRDAEAYLTDRANRGFTVIQAMIAWGGGPDYKGLPAANEHGFRPWTDDPTAPNEGHFTNIDRLVEKAAELGLVLAIMPTWGYYVNEAKVITASNARAYGRCLGQRYRHDPNVIWVNGGDRVPDGVADVYRELAFGLREGDGGSHLITYHASGMRSSSQFFQRDTWLDFHMIQTWTDWPKIYWMILADAWQAPTRPVVLGEGAYEDGPEYPLGPITPAIVRRQVWWTFMAGGYFSHGQNQMWRMEGDWKATFETPGTRHIMQFKAIALSRPWWNRVPDQTVIASGVSSERTLNAAVRSVDSDWAMIYLSSPCHVLIQLDKILAREVKATWVNPQNGETLEAGTYATGNLNNQTFPTWTTQGFSTPPFWDDAVLLLDAVAPA